MSGCSTPHGDIPGAAATVRTPDLDGDGKAETEFFSKSIVYGVKTAAGALIEVNTAKFLTGGGDRHAWAMTMKAEPPVALVDDGHTASVFALVHCKFVAPTSGGKPYRFTLYGWGKYGTGVSCVGSERGGYNLAGLNLVKVAGGYRIDTTFVNISKDGKTAKNGQTVKGTKTFAANSATVAHAKESYCPLVPRITEQGQ